MHMRETVAVYEVMLDGKSISTMKAMRQVLRDCDKETCIECSLVLKQVSFSMSVYVGGEGRGEWEHGFKAYVG